LDYLIVPISTQLEAIYTVLASLECWN